MSMTQESPIVEWTAPRDLWRCVSCRGTCAESQSGLCCTSCGRTFPIREGLLVVEERLEGNNRTVRDFYNSPLWPKFRFWEWFTFLCNGGERRSRNKVLRHLPQTDHLRLLDVAIGDGVYLDWLPKTWDIVGIDISSVQLAACQRRTVGRNVPLVLGEAEDLPFADNWFDAILSIGGFNYFNDPARALQEMSRVVRPGGTIVISDEIPNLTDKMLGHKLKIGPLMNVERWCVSRLMHLGDDFTEIVERFRDLNVSAIGRSVLPDCRYELIWQGVGYVMYGTVPE